MLPLNLKLAHFKQAFEKVDKCLLFFPVNMYVCKVNMYEVFYGVLKYIHLK
jgi:hypothetical protein